MKPNKFRVAAGAKVDLAALATDASGRYADEERAKAFAEEQLERLRRAQHIFQAHSQYGLLIILQGMDGAGKDETIQTVFTAFDPQICHARQFKAPSTTEAQYGFLWRASQALPARGQVAVFNRSYYEQVTTEQVYPEELEAWGLPPEARKRIWERRYQQINDFERYLVENGFQVIKLFLHISKETERVRLLERVEQPEQQGELSAADLQHHDDWDALQRSFEAMLSNTSTKHAPWHVIPSNQRWHTYAAVTSVLLAQLDALHEEYPELDEETEQLLKRARKELGGKR